MDNKLDLKKENIELYSGKAGEVKKIFCKKSYYISLDGEGNPNTSNRYKDGIEALYKLAYGLKFFYKSKDKDFVVMPLSALWWTENMEELTEENKEFWKWKSMIEIPSFVEEEVFYKVREDVYKKTKIELLYEILPREMNEGNCYQILHLGAYTEEKGDIQKLHEKIKEDGYKHIGYHHEIYLNDIRKVSVDKLKTIIRQPVFKEREEMLNFESEKDNFFNLLGESKTMVLATTDGENVSARNLSIIIDNDKFYFQTDSNFKKCRDIEKNNNVALCVDNIQIEGKVTNTGYFYGKDFENFKIKFKKYHIGSYKAYSKLIYNKIFEIEPINISLYKYEDNDVYRFFLDFKNKVSYKRWYLRN